MVQGLRDRAYWIKTMRRICDPVLRSLQNRTLCQDMPVQQAPGQDRAQYACLEALGRTLMGIAPWLECAGLPAEEEALRAGYAQMCREAIDAATDPKSPDLMRFAEKTGDQPLVDAAFLATGILRAPGALWHKLPGRVQSNLVDCLASTRTRQDVMENNHILFSALVEAALYKMGAPVQWSRVEHALARCEAWYLGDGMYADGGAFYWDYYNSYVIHPALVELYGVFMGSEFPSPHLTEANAARVLGRARRAAHVLEMLIARDGTFPALGRSIVYRMAAFHLLAQSALRGDLPAQIEPAQVRSALSVVIRNCMEAPGTFDGEGWLRIGLAGHQPLLGDVYISTGSLYQCMHVFLPLGLPPDDPFWSSGAADWHSVRIWGGENLPGNHAYTERDA